MWGAIVLPARPWMERYQAERPKNSAASQLQLDRAVRAELQRIYCTKSARRPQLCKGASIRCTESDQGRTVEK